MGAVEARDQVRSMDIGQRLEMNTQEIIEGNNTRSVCPSSNYHPSRTEQQATGRAQS